VTGPDLGSSSSSGSGSITTNPDGSLNFDDLGDGSTTFDGEGGFQGPDTKEPNWGEIGGVAALFGIAYLMAVALLDARRRTGVATAFVVPGVVALVYAIVFLGIESDNVLVAGVLSVAAGLFCGSIGTQAHRRFTVWFGAFFATVGALLVAGKLTADAVNDNGDNTGYLFGAFTIGFGLLMAAVALVTARVLREPPNGDDPTDDGGAGAAPVAPPPAPTPYFET
jgi:uncharacterized membrane protein HdeD (DUF308 family)